ncbi:hypothetical protein PRN20_04770 [Devosia sp. ZB163]|uniref:hypothetical protein n=1 Tax=Devosia sp. ZB163 TaxID=3025938 RepID=UPI0023603416|nr:hypothetical protein [Devosia sp. ZB163]MDC9823036.1 hypothetical protein [Devosia sp. ZB163]
MTENDIAEAFDFTDLGEQLRGPNGADIAAATIARLGQLKDGVAGKLAGGLPPGEYERHTALSEALAAAQAVMVRISSLITVIPGGTLGAAPAKKGE